VEFTQDEIRCFDHQLLFPPFQLDYYPPFQKPHMASLDNEQVVNHTMLGGGVTQGFLNGKVTVAVQTTYTDTFVQCLVDGVWKSFGMVNNLG